ncbi:hypothetical protein C7974DRAFT_309073 [Boeremia exigua]|uniref:uncharacterized protein n=1 Tax=Boeremia exigua TaxID=749465 RepID=UPI001E8CD0F1|nr:uncharacterized protein C7974DRAFT_309073 [Boeremia exigua]KAH6633772.1 hypothetical protein C7974DRAFT_309073 [Boeremia exigua]
MVAGAISAFFGLSLLATRSNVNVIGDLADAPGLPLAAGRDYVHLADDTISQKKHDMRLLSSIRNPKGFYNSIDVGKSEFNILNPTILELPSGSEHEFLVIARFPLVETEINGRKYRLSRQVAVFANMTYNALQRPMLTACKWSKRLGDQYAGPDHHCKNEPILDQHIGPEDMKLFWTRSGAPLLIFTLQSKHEILCQGMFLLDARVAVPELTRILGGHARLMPAIQLKTPTRIRRMVPPGYENDSRYQRDKNWAPFQSPFDKNDNEHFFVVEPGRVFRWTMDNEIVEDVGASSISAVEEPYPPWVGSSTWHSIEKTCLHDVMMADKLVHQSTPMLFLTLCNRGKCEPHEDNTVMLAMVHRRYEHYSVHPHISYDRRIVVYAAAPPYRMLSVSKKLYYLGETDESFIWTGSMVYFFNHTNVISNRSHGFLDDEIWLGFGITDLAAGWLDVEARDLVQDHNMCQGAPYNYRKNLKKNSLL